MQSTHPETFTDADTSSGYRQETRPGTSSKYEFYYSPTRNYLRRIGCAPEMVDDLTHAALVKLPHIIAKYDVSKGAFRPYYKQSIRNLYRDYIRLNAASVTSSVVPFPEADASRSSDDDGIDMDLLKARAREVVEWFLRDCSDPTVMKGMAILQRWIVDGERLETIAKDPLIGCSTRYARRLHRRASDVFGTWIKTRFEPAEWEKLLTYGQQVMPVLRTRVTEDCNLLTDLFRWMSERKRMAIMAFLLVLFTSLAVSADKKPETDT